MATQKVVLNPYNNLTLVSGTQYNLVAPDPGYYFINVLNRSTGDLAISNASTVSTTDPASYVIPSGGSQAQDVGYNKHVWGPSGIWVAGVGAISVALVPRS